MSISLLLNKVLPTYAARAGRTRQAIIENCAHPDYKNILWDYVKMSSKGQTPHCIPAALAMHDTLAKKGDMRLIDWAEYK